MIKLTDLLNETENSNPNIRWKQHIEEIIKCAEKALMSNDPGLVATQIALMADHARFAGDKHKASVPKQQTSQYVNSNISNSYAGDDSDINAYIGQRI
jgi:hypothetical protein